MGEKPRRWRRLPLLMPRFHLSQSFSWMTPLMKKGVQQYITEQDLPALIPSDESENLGKDLEKAMAKRCEPLPSRLLQVP